MSSPSNVSRRDALSIERGERLTAVVVATLIGVFLLIGVGFAQPDILHNAAHDARHARYPRARVRPARSRLTRSLAAQPLLALALSSGVTLARPDFFLLPSRASRPSIEAPASTSRLS